MTLDILTLSRLNKLKNSGGLGYTEPFTARCVFPATMEEVTSDVSIMGGEFKWFSSATPTKDELMSCKVKATRDGQSVEVDFFVLNPEIMIETDTAYAVEAGGTVYMVSTVTENELGTLPKIGMYYSTHTISGLDSAFPFGEVWTFIFSETIHPIDPKYLPTTEIDLIAEFGQSGVTVGSSETLTGSGYGDTFLSKALGQFQVRLKIMDDENTGSEHIVTMSKFTSSDTNSFIGETYAYSSGQYLTVRMRASGDTVKISVTKVITSLPGVTIDLGAYGIDLATLVMSGGGTVEVLQTSEMWQKINENADCDLRFSTVIGVERYTFTPVVISKVDGEVVNLGMLLAVVNSGVMVSANIQLTKFTIGDSSEGTFVYATVTQTPIPTT